MKTHKNDILNEQTQFISHALFEHITPHTRNIDLSKVVTIMCIKVTVNLGSKTLAKAKKKHCIMYHFLLQQG